MISTKFKQQQVKINIIIEHPQILWWILSFIALGFIFGFKIFPYVVNKLCLDELTWLVQKTILKSYFVFKYSAFAVISIYIVVGFYYVFFLKEIVLGLILLGFTGFLIYTTYQSEKKGKSIKQFFDFLKYSTPVSFYNKQNDEDRRASFSSVVERIKRTENGLKNVSYLERSAWSYQYAYARKFSLSIIDFKSNVLRVGGFHIPNSYKWSTSGLSNFLKLF